MRPEFSFSGLKWNQIELVVGSAKDNLSSGVGIEAEITDGAIICNNGEILETGRRAHHRVDRLGGDPGDYLKATLQAIASGHPADHIDDLMPWTFNQASR